MNEPKFKAGDTVYVAYLRINEDEVDWDVVRATCRGYKPKTTKPVVIGDRGDGRMILAYEEDCFAAEIDAVARTMTRIGRFKDRCIDEVSILNRKGLDILAARAKEAS